MAGKTLDFMEMLSGSEDQLARTISQTYQQWEQFRVTWATEKAELRDYLFATSTKTTTNKKLPWKNSTTIPKLTQIRDNLHANYMAALFPNSNWLSWEGNRIEDETEAKREAIEAYMRTKIRQSSAEVDISGLILDYIDYGNVFATAKWVDESYTDPNSGEVTRGYVGPKIVRISPLDITFNPLAPSFMESPKIVRSVTSLGELTKQGLKMPLQSLERKLLLTALDKSINTRKMMRTISQGDVFKSQGYTMDGFGTIQLYFQSDYVEVLTFYGDFYDVENNKFLENHVITIIDRLFIVDKRPNPDWTRGPGIFHAGWRLRPDNLYAMGPLDNLVGMQYRIDHLENLKADVFDLIAYPVMKIKGFVEDFTYQPGEHINVGEEGDVAFMHPEVTALNADMQIQELERRMEELAGAPREAMGFRTPGEKTKFEVQLLDNASSRIFLNKITHFEKVFLEQLLNYMLQLARRNMSGSDVTRTLDSDIDAAIFTSVTRDDIVANGILRPQGARRFAQQANQLQSLMSVLNGNVGKDPSIITHLSGKKIAKLIEELADLEEFKIFGDNIRVFEQQETQRLMHAATEQSDVAAATPAGVTEGDPANPNVRVPPHPILKQQMVPVGQVPGGQGQNQPNGS